MTITPETIRAFAEQLRREERSAGTVENYLRHVGWEARDKGGGQRMEKLPGSKRLPPGHCERHAGAVEPAVQIFGL